MLGHNGHLLLLLKVHELLDQLILLILAFLDALPDLLAVLLLEAQLGLHAFVDDLADFAVVRRAKLRLQVHHETDRVNQLSVQVPLVFVYSVQFH